MEEYKDTSHHPVAVLEPTYDEVDNINSSLNPLAYHTFNNLSSCHDDSIIGGKCCGCLHITRSTQEKLIVILATLSGIFTLGVVCGLIYYADQVNITYFPPGLAYAIYVAIGFSAVVGPISSFFLTTVISFNNEKMMDIMPIVSSNDTNNGRDIKFCCYRRIGIEYYPIKNLRTIFGVYFLGITIPGLIIILQITNSHH